MNNHINIEQQYCCVKYLNNYNFLFQASDEKIAVEINLIEEANIKVDSEEVCDPNDNQANYDGNKWIFICSSMVFMLYRFYCCYYNIFHHYIFIPIKYR